MKRICTMLFGAVLVCVLMGCGLGLSSPAQASAPQSQVLASVDSGSTSASAQTDVSSTDLLRARLGLNGDRASAVSIVGGVGLILVGCAGLYLLEKT